MQKRYWQFYLSFSLTVSLTLTACGAAPEEIESVATLDNATWPTPIPSTPIPSPTPFPMILLEDIATPTVVAAETTIETVIETAIETAPQNNETIVEAATAVAEVAQQVGASGEVEALIETVTSSMSSQDILNNLTSVIEATVEIVALNVRQGPGPEYGTLDPLVQGDLVKILGRSADQLWGLIETPNGELGWVDLEYLSTQLDLAQLPTLTPASPSAEFPLDQIVPIVQIDGLPASVTINSTISTALATDDEQTVRPVASGPTDQEIGLYLPPITEARIAKVEVEVRSGPSTEYAPIDKLTDTAEKIDVLALDPTGQWVLVEPEHLDSRTGWLRLDDLNLSDSISDAPQVVTAWVERNEVPVRAGPGLFHPQIGTFAINSLVTVLGRNEANSWVMVQPLTGGGVGWMRPQDLTLHTPLRELPLAPEPTFQPTNPAAITASPVQREVVDYGKLVIQQSSGGDIWVINRDGSELRTVTTGLDPALSPDAQTIAFTRWDQGEAGNGTVRVINIDGSNERIVQEFIKQPKGPSWSPDGQQLVVNYQDGGRLQEERSCHDQGRRPPINAFDIKPSLNTDEGRLELCWSVPPDPHWGLRVINLTEDRYEDLDGGTYAFRPAWDPVQSWRIVSDGGRGLLAVDVNQHSQSIKLTENLNDGSPVFSPDGRFIAMTTGQQSSGGQGFNIYRMNSDGGGRVQLTKTPLWVSVQPDDAPAWNNVAPAWSPDGTQIAFLTDRTGRWEIWLMNAEGSNPGPMFAEEINAQLNLTYNFVDERVLSWR